MFQMIKDLQISVKKLQQQMTNLDERIELLEHDAYEKHTEDMEEDSSSNTDTLSTSTELVTSPLTSSSSKEHHFDIHSEQTSLNVKINSIENTMNQMINLLNTSQLLSPSPINH